MPMLAALGHAAAELVFYAMVGVWYLLTVQYDIVDRWLGSPDLNRRHTGTRREHEVEAAGLEAALSWSAAKMGPDGAGVLADAAARASAQMPAEGGPGPGMQEAAAEAGAQAQQDMAHQTGEVSADAASLLRRRRAGLARISSRDSIGTTDTDCDNERTLYGKLKRKMPMRERFNVKQRVEQRLLRFGNDMMPDIAASIGVEAAAGTLAAALPSGIRDAGVRAVDRAEAAVRRWAMFVGGVAVLFRVLLWH